jgi:minor curlin subunit
MKCILIPSLIALAALTATPASAGGSLSFEFTPSNPDEANAVRLGLALYAIGRAIEGDASVIQNGTGNAAGIGQFGNGNFGVIEQNGDGHAATLAQDGDNNAYGIFQFGTGTSGHVAQSGNGGTGLLFQAGWD